MESRDMPEVGETIEITGLDGATYHGKVTSIEPCATCGTCINVDCPEYSGQRTRHTDWRGDKTMGWNFLSRTEGVDK